MLANSARWLAVLFVLLAPSLTTAKGGAAFTVVGKVEVLEVAENFVLVRVHDGGVLRVAACGSVRCSEIVETVIPLNNKEVELRPSVEGIYVLASENARMISVIGRDEDSVFRLGQAGTRRLDRAALAEILEAHSRYDRDVWIQLEDPNVTFAHGQVQAIGSAVIRISQPPIP